MMNLPPDLSRYLHARRGRISASHPAIAEIYSSQYERLGALLQDFGLSRMPQFLAVRSPFALTEFVRSDEESYIVYDQFLGQILSRLTALTAQRASQLSVDTYLCKLLADRLLVRGDGRRALIVALTHQVLLLSDDFSASPDVDRLQSVGIQETFVMAHELGHFALETNEQFRAMWNGLYSEYIRIAEENTQEELEGLVGPLDFTRTLLEDHNRSWTRHFGEISAQDLEWGYQEAQRRSQESAVPKHDVTSQLANPRIRDEMLADGLAAFLVALSGVRASGEDQLKSLGACLQASQHLRLIQLMDHRLLRPFAAEETLREQTVRGAALRLFLRALVESRLIALDGLDRDPVKALHMMLRSVNTAFYEVIFDGVIYEHFYARFEAPSVAEGMQRAVAQLPSRSSSWHEAAEIIGV